MSSFHLHLTAQGREAKLRIEVTGPPGKEVWHCFPADFLGAHRGKVAWRKNELALFSDSGAVHGALAYAVLVIPEIGFDNVAEGTSGSLRTENLGSGTWTLIKKTVS